jgi:hypothetical protein
MTAITQSSVGRKRTVKKGKRIRFALDLTFDAHVKLVQLDKSLVGTDDYMGLAFFWNYEYKWPMRLASSRECIKVHDAFIYAGLPLNGESPAHDAIIERFGLNVKYETRGL